MKISSKYSIIIPTSSPPALSHPLYPPPYFRITQISKLQDPTPTNLPHPTPGKKICLPIYTRKHKQNSKKRNPEPKIYDIPPAVMGIEACKMDRGKAEKK